MSLALALLLTAACAFVVGGVVGTVLGYTMAIVVYLGDLA